VAFRATPGERVTVSTPQQATGGLSVVNHFNISGAQDPRSQQQIAAEVGASITRAMRRYN
jgi:hypothetical protein